MADPQSADEWFRLAGNHQRAAETMCEDRKAASIAHQHVGFAVEAALKAVIMRKEGLNHWPDRQSRPDLHTHDLRSLMSIAGLAVGRADPVAPSWHVVSQWDRSQGYDPRAMPRKVARQMVEAGFGPEGVVPWLIKNA